MGDPTTAVGDSEGRGDRSGDGGDDADERWYLNDQREFLLRSLADAESEHEAGDLTDEDFALLTGRDQRKLIEVEEGLSRFAPTEESFASAESAGGVGSSVAVKEVAAAVAPKMARWRLIGILASCVLIIAGVVILVDHAISPRLAGQAVSGSIIQTKEDLIEQQLQQAAIDNNNGHLSAALTLYTKVLREDPTDPTALAQSGWLEWNAGVTSGTTRLQTVGEDSERAAIKVAPSLYASHLYLGLILYNQKISNPAAAVVQFDEFLADSPPAAEVQSAASRIAGAYKAAGVAVPAVVTADLSSGTAAAG
jgi:hypothetical protein